MHSIVPSLLGINPQSLGAITAAMAHLDSAATPPDFYHVDVMDGRFVPNETIYKPGIVAQLSRSTRTQLDVHLMVDDPVRYVLNALDTYVGAGIAALTFHQEAALDDAPGLLALIGEHHMLSGISLKPTTPLCALDESLPYADTVLLMSVEPGQGGQSYLPEATERIRALRSRFNGIIAVDGGITLENYREPLDAGADLLIAGSAIFDAEDLQEALTRLREE